MGFPHSLPFFLASMIGSTPRSRRSRRCPYLADAATTAHLWTLCFRVSEHLQATTENSQKRKRCSGGLFLDDCSLDSLYNTGYITIRSCCMSYPTV